MTIKFTVLRTSDKQVLLVLQVAYVFLTYCRHLIVFFALDPIAFP